MKSRLLIAALAGFAVLASGFAPDAAHAKKKKKKSSAAGIYAGVTFHYDQTPVRFRLTPQLGVPQLAACVARLGAESSPDQDKPGFEWAAVKQVKRKNR